MINFLAGIVFGFIMLAMYSCLVVASQSDDQMESYHKENKDEFMDEL